MALSIGPYNLSVPLLLAPMAGATDYPFRQICRQNGAALCTSEMLTADQGLWSSRKSRSRLPVTDEPAPRSVQIAGADPRQMAESARACVDLGAQIIDINMGCPAKKVCKVAAGSALLMNEKLVAEIVTAVVEAVQVPVTLKIRTGWNRQNRNGVRIAQIAEKAGVSMLSVHGRTRECRFMGQAEYATIADIAKVVSIPVIANGDIDSPEKACQVLAQTGAAGLMIGRAALGHPWLFREISERLSGTRSTPVSAERKYQAMLDHLGRIHRYYDEPLAVRLSRKHVGWYLSDLPDNRALINRFNMLESTSDQYRLLDSQSQQLFVTVSSSQKQAA